MDLKLKGKSWTGNIYHQFESICQDVDDFMTKDPVKFVENQVQGVGRSVKRFYSNVVHDILPLSGDIMKPKSVSVDDEQVCIKEKELSVNQGSVDALRSLDESSPIKLDKPPSSDPSKKAKNYLHSKEDGDAIIWNDVEDDVEKDISRVSMPASANSGLDSEMFSGMSDGDSTCGVSQRALAKNETLCDSLSTKDERSDVSSSVHPPEHEFSFSWGEDEEDEEKYEEDLISSKSCSVLESTSANLTILCDNVCHSLAESNSLSTRDERSDVSSSVYPPELDLSFSWGEDEENCEEYSISSKSCSVLESTSTNLTIMRDNICHSLAESNDCAYDVSTLSTSSAVHETIVLPDFLILKSKGSSVPSSTLADNDASRIDGLSKIMHEQHYKDFLPQIAVAPSETGGTSQFGDVTYDDLNMETVNLSPDKKNDGRDVVLNANFFDSASFRRRNFRYYKKLIQDAFTSRTRLSKEYEHLAILYGDIDIESNQFFGASSSTNTSMNAIRTPLSQEIHETEWELL